MMETFNLDPARSIGSVVAEDYRIAPVLTRHGIDFCCKGGRSVQEVCDSQGIDQAALERDIAEALARSGAEQQDARNWALDELADHVENVHHRYVEQAGPVIKQYLEKLCRVHGDRHPELFTIQEEFNTCLGAMAMHMKKEELILFPFVRKLARSQRDGLPLKEPRFGSVENPVRAMMDDHADEGERFERIKELSNGYTLPADGCATYAAALKALQEFEADLHRHIHLENNIMFPRAIELEKELPKATA